MTFEESARSSLCQLPLRPADLNSRILAARETLDKSRQALFAHFDRAFGDDEDFGDWLLLHCIHDAMHHAANLLGENSQPECPATSADIEVCVSLTDLEVALLSALGQKEGLTVTKLMEKFIKAGLTNDEPVEKAACN